MGDSKMPISENENIEEVSEQAEAETNLSQNEIPTTMPVLAVRDIVVFNYMILQIGRAHV